MAITSVGSSGMQLLRQADQQVSGASQKLASITAETAPPETRSTDALIDLQQGEAYSKVGARVIEAENATLGSLLDISV